MGGGEYQKALLMSMAAKTVRSGVGFWLKPINIRCKKDACLVILSKTVLGG